MLPDPVQVIMPLGATIDLIGKGLRTGQVHEPIRSTEQIATWVEHSRIGAVDLMDTAR
jgi:hypothetical protein